MGTDTPWPRTVPRVIVNADWLVAAGEGSAEARVQVCLGSYLAVFS
jgi:hypothetical protein